MSAYKIVIASALMVVLFAYGCKSEPQNPYPQGYPQQAVPGQMPNMQQVPQQMQQPVQPVQPAQAVPAAPAAPAAAPGQPADPFGGLGAALGQAMGQAMGQAAGQQPAGGVTMIPWKSLSQALPTAAPGWTLDGQVEGESANMMGISVSTARCTLKQGAMVAKIEIVDTTMNPMIAMPFNMARAIQVDSSEERRGPVNFGVYPATQGWNKKSNEADVMAMVHNRVMVTVSVTNAGSEVPANQLANQINYAHLASLVGG